MRSALVAALVAVAGCGNDLPSASLIDKLRILAVQAEPPEVAPGQPSMLSTLTVEPPIPQLDGGAPSPVSFLWLACTIPPGTTQQIPCGISGGAITALPPFCKDQPDAPLCVIGADATGTYTAPASILGSNGTGQLLLTVVAADTPDGAIGCLMSTAAHHAEPLNPDHCVLALKRLTVSDPNRKLSDGSPAPPPNANPKLIDFYYTDEVSNTSLVDGTGTFPVAPDKDAKAFRLVGTRADDAAQMEPTTDSDGKPTGLAYEGLTIAWFVTAGKIDGGRSAFVPDGCDTQEACPTKSPKVQTDTKWTPPTQSDLAMHSPDGSVQLWAVIRDDRGGVSWRAGTAKVR
jgi:hypothetical protein